MIAWFEARAWQVGTVAAGAVALSLGVSTVVLSFQKAGLERDVAKLEKTNAESSRNLQTCRWNTVDLEEAVFEQNQEILEISQVSSAKLAEAEAAVVAARGESGRLRKEVDRLLSAPSSSPDICLRVQDIDRAVREAFR